MKRFLDKTWTKVVAYFLFFIFTALAVANTAGVVYFFSHEIYLQGEAAAREALYYSQADNVADAVQVWLLNSKSEEEFIKAVRDRCPAENGYGIMVTQPDGKNTTVTALPEDAKIVYTYDRWLDIDGKELVITVSLQEGFLPRTYEYRFGLWLLDMKNALIPLTVLFVVLTLFCFFWQMAAAGHWQGFEGIHLTWFDKIPAGSDGGRYSHSRPRHFRGILFIQFPLVEGAVGNSYSLFCLSVYHLLCHPLQGRNGAEEQCRLVCH